MFNMFKKNEEKTVTEAVQETVTSGYVQVLDDKGEPTEKIPESVTTTSIEEKEPIEFPQPPPLGYREMKYLKRAKYDKVSSNPLFKKSYLIQNKRTGQMAEIKAASAYHACNIIGWKANKVQVIMEKDLSQIPETTSLNK